LRVNCLVRVSQISGRNSSGPAEEIASGGLR
jgi:hypothetical protein